MIVLFCRTRVADFSKWNDVFDSHSHAHRCGAEIHRRIAPDRIAGIHDQGNFEQKIQEQEERSGVHGEIEAEGKEQPPPRNTRRPALPDSLDKQPGLLSVCAGPSHRPEDNRF